MVNIGIMTQRRIMRVTRHIARMEEMITYTKLYMESMEEISWGK